MSDEPIKVIQPTNDRENPVKVYTSDDEAWDKAWIDWAYEMKARMKKRYGW